MRMENPSVVATLSGSCAALASHYHGESRDAWHSVMMSFAPGPFMTPKKASKGRAREDLAGRTRHREDRSSVTDAFPTKPDAVIALRVGASTHDIRAPAPRRSSRRARAGASADHPSARSSPGRFPRCGRYGGVQARPRRVPALPARQRAEPRDWSLRLKLTVVTERGGLCVEKRVTAPLPLEHGAQLPRVRVTGRNGGHLRPLRTVRISARENDCGKENGSCAQCDHAQRREEPHPSPTSFRSNSTRT